MFWNFSPEQTNLNETVFLDAYIEAPTNTPHSGGIYRFSIKVSAEYPFKIPLFLLTTPYFHPTSNKTFDPCPMTFHGMPFIGDFSPIMTIRFMLTRFREDLMLYYSDEWITSGCGWDFRLKD